MQICSKADLFTLPAKFELCERMTVADIEVFLPDSKRERFMKNPCGKIFSGYITLTEGRNHQVKRMLKAVGCTVAYLKRVSIGELTCLRQRLLWI